MTWPVVLGAQARQCVIQTAGQDSEVRHVLVAGLDLLESLGPRAGGFLARSRSSRGPEDDKSRPGRLVFRVQARAKRVQVLEIRLDTDPSTSTWRVDYEFVSSSLRHASPDRTTTLLLRVACGRLPLVYRHRYAEEWQAELRDLPRRSRWVYGLRLLFHARATAAALMWTPSSGLDRQRPW